MNFLRSSNMGIKLMILHVLNQCLAIGIYPWNTSLVTPLHKQGDRANLDNYRAIAVNSAIRKLFSNIMFEQSRLTGQKGHFSASRFEVSVLLGRESMVCSKLESISKNNLGLMDDVLCSARACLNLRFSINAMLWLTESSYCLDF